MKSLVKAAAEPGLWFDDRPVPTIRPDEVLIKVNKTGICGTDVHIYQWDEWARKTVPVPMIVGHEFAGEIAALGTAVRGLKEGQRVSGEGHIVGSQSRAVRAGRFHCDPTTRGVGINVPGAFAEYLALPAFNVVPLPDMIDDELGAILDPLGNAVHTALTFDLVGEDVLITGAGPIGIMAAAIARHVGARHVVITDVNRYRLELAGRVADVVPVHVGEERLADIMSRLRIREGFDVALEMSGAPAAFETIIRHTIMGGKVALLGIPSKPFDIDVAALVFKMFTLRGIYGREMFETWYKMLAMLESGLSIRGIITHRLAANDYEKGFELMASGLCGKVVLDWANS